MTYVTDPIGDLLTRMSNAQHARRAECRMPWSRMREELLRLLKKEGWIKDVELTGTKPFTEIIVTFDDTKPVLELKRVSKPGRRAYASYKELKPILNGFGMAVITTSKGLMTDGQARKERLGGEIICTIS